MSISIFGAVLLGCASETPVPTNDEINPEALRFAAPAQAARFEAAMSAAAQRAAGWRAIPLTHRGSSVRARWCSDHIPEKACARGLAARKRIPGSGWQSVGAVAYGARFPEVFGFTWEAGALPASQGWGAVVTMSTGAAPIVGDGLTATFLRLADGSVAEALVWGGQMSLTVGHKTLSPAPPSPDDLLAAWQTEAGLVSSVTGLIDDLRSQADALLETGAIRTLGHGAYQGGGVPPDPILQVPDDAEMAAIHAEATETLSRWEATLASEPAALHAALLPLLPPTAP